MLKLTYVEADLFLERLDYTLETFVAERVVLAVRLGQELQVQPSGASFLLPTDLSKLSMLETAIRLEQTQALSIATVDDDYAEVSLRGTWVASDSEAHAGVFVCAIAPVIEGLITELWELAHCHVSYLR